jgi:hypothetical protein
MPSGGWTLFFCVTSYKAIGVPIGLYERFSAVVG